MVPPSQGCSSLPMSSPLLLANSIHPQGAPSKFAPARLWKEASLHLVPLLLPVVNLQDTVLPSGWHEVQVCTIPKTAIAKLPKQLRPISLLHPGGKLLATMIAHRVLPKVERYLQSTPQWAYLPGRSTGDALEAVCAAHAPATSLRQTYNVNPPSKCAAASRFPLIYIKPLTLFPMKPF